MSWAGLVGQIASSTKGLVGSAMEGARNDVAQENAITRFMEALTNKTDARDNSSTPTHTQAGTGWDTIMEVIGDLFSPSDANAPQHEYDFPGDRCHQNPDPNCDQHTDVADPDNSDQENGDWGGIAEPADPDGSDEAGGDWGGGAEAAEADGSDEAGGDFGGEAESADADGSECADGECGGESEAADSDGSDSAGGDW